MQAHILLSQTIYCTIAHLCYIQAVCGLFRSEYLLVRLFVLYFCVRHFFFDTRLRMPSDVTVIKCNSNFISSDIWTFKVVPSDICALRRHGSSFFRWIKILEPQHQKIFLLTYASSEDSDQPAHSSSLIRIFTGRILKDQGFFLRITNIHHENIPI